MKILIDMDDTIEHLGSVWVDYLNEKYGTDVVWENITEWDFNKSFPTLTVEEVHSPLLDKKLWERVKPIDGAAEYMKKLIDDGHDVYIVTSSYYKSLAIKLDCVLFKYFPFITWRKVIVSDRKQMVRGDVLIDDGVHNLIDGEYIKILMDAPHNRNFDESSYGIYRVKTWEEIYEYINSLNDRPSYKGVRGKEEPIDQIGVEECMEM